MLRLSTIQVGDIAIINCSGTIVLGESTTRLRETATAAAARCIVLDLEEITSVDAAGLGTLVFLQQWARRSGQVLRLMNVPDEVRRLFAKAFRP